MFNNDLVSTTSRQFQYEHSDICVDIVNLCCTPAGTTTFEIVVGSFSSPDKQTIIKAVAVDPWLSRVDMQMDGLTVPKFPLRSRFAKAAFLDEARKMVYSLLVLGRYDLSVCNTFEIPTPVIHIPAVDSDAPYMEFEVRQSSVISSAERGAVQIQPALRTAKNMIFTVVPYKVSADGSESHLSAIVANDSLVVCIIDTENQDDAYKEAVGKNWTEIYDGATAVTPKLVDALTKGLGDITPVCLPALRNGVLVQSFNGTSAITHVLNVADVVFEQTVHIRPVMEVTIHESGDHRVTIHFGPRLLSSPEDIHSFSGELSRALSRSLQWYERVAASGMTETDDPIMAEFYAAHLRPDDRIDFHLYRSVNGGVRFTVSADTPRRSMYSILLENAVL